MNYHGDDSAPRLGRSVSLSNFAASAKCKNAYGMGMKAHAKVPRVPVTSEAFSEMHRRQEQSHLTVAAIHPGRDIHANPRHAWTRAEAETRCAPFKAQPLGLISVVKTGAADKVEGKTVCSLATNNEE